MRYTVIGSATAAALLIIIIASVRIIGGRGLEPFDPQVHLVLDEACTVNARFVPLEGSLNTRDAGGYVTESGQTVRTGIFYRSGHFSRLTDADLETLEVLGIQTVVDLREPRRAASYPNRLPETVTLLHMPIYDDTKPLHLELLFNRKAIDDRFSSYYIEYLEIWGHRMQGVFELLADGTNTPMVIHCSNGKDRVGVITALLLELLGVPRDVIVSDFLLSNLHLEEALESFIVHEEGRYILWLGIPREDLHALMGVNPQWLTGALEYMDDVYGSVENYLTQRVGLDEATLEAIRRRML